MKVHPVQMLSALLLLASLLCPAQAPSSKNAAAVVLQAFETHDIVMLGEIHWNKQEYEWLQSLIETNMRRHSKHQMRVLCGDPYINWDKVRTKDDIGPFLGHRDQWYAHVVEDEVLGKHYRAFLIAGSAHFLREHGEGYGEGYIEPELRRAGAKTFLILAGTNAVKGYDDQS